jgi:hypothetical protein
MQFETLVATNVASTSIVLYLFGGAACSSLVLPGAPHASCADGQQVDAHHKVSNLHLQQNHIEK